MLLGLTGCGSSLGDTLASSADSSEAIPGRIIHGNVHGGVYPIQNATIRLMETQSNGYGGAAKKLLSTTSDQNGDFTFPDTGWTCDSGQFAYITVTSGYTVNLGTSTSNNDVVQVGVVGPCTSLATQSEIDNINVFVSELSTVAAAYALGNFISIDSTNASTGEQIVNISAPANNSGTGGCTVSASGVVSACTGAGLAHGFSLAAILVNSVNLNGTFPTGQAQFSNPNTGVSSVPAPIINTLGDILQTCVDSVAGSQCGSLFTDATPPGGTAPTNTLQVVMDMAKYPTNNISQLFALQSPAVPFTPYLASAPTSFTVSIFYGVTYAGSNVQYPIDIALDASDNAYVLYANNTVGSSSDTYTAVDAFSAVGKTLYTGAHNTTYLYPTQIAVDAAGNVYVTNDDPTTANDALLMAASSKNGTLSPVATLTNAYGLAVDNSSNVWVSTTQSTAASISEYTLTGLKVAAATNASTFISAVPIQRSATLGGVYGLALDSQQNVWGAGLNSSGDALAVLWVNTGTSTNAAYTAGGGISKAFTKGSPFSVAPFSTGMAYFPLNDTLTSAAYTPSNTTLTAAGNGSIATTAAIPHRSQVDGAGHVFWTDLESTGLLYMYTPPSSGSMSGGTLVSLLPCFAYPDGSAYNCITDSNQSSSNQNYTPAYVRGMAIDSAGNLWYTADAGFGAVIETLGLASPTWPLLSYGHPGSAPQ